MDSSVETVNAAAAAIASAESRVQQATVPRRRWSSYFRLYWCFGSHHQSKRISHAVLIPALPPPPDTAPPAENSSYPPPLVRPFIAPPSSPVSFLQSGPPSATLSPAGGITLSALSADIYSPGGRPSIFAIGPYAHETQLVSPPVFSTFTTEPSTAPLTPPPESVQFTTPSSPEVPFAKLLSSVDSNSKKSDPYELNSYQLYPGSPVGHLISPSSVCSGTSSPFPEREFHSLRTGSPFPIQMDRPDFHELVTRHASKTSGSLFTGQISTANPSIDTTFCGHGNEPPLVHRVSFELTSEDVTRCLDRKSIFPSKAASEFPVVVTKTSIGKVQDEADDSHDDISFVGTSIDSPGITLLNVKEFKFSNSDSKPGMGSHWWANEKKFGMESSPKDNWAFFPLIQPGMS